MEVKRRADLHGFLGREIVLMHPVRNRSESVATIDIPVM
jgi:hypothetical protein